jgi:hypothetical protein
LAWTIITIIMQILQLSPRNYFLLFGYFCSCLPCQAGVSSSVSG